jgi:hypothetical protein
MVPAHTSDGVRRRRLAWMQAQNRIFAPCARLGFSAPWDGVRGRGRSVSTQMKRQRQCWIGGRCRLHQQRFQAWLLGRRFLVLRFPRGVLFTQLMRDETGVGDRCRPTAVVMDRCFRRSQHRESNKDQQVYRSHTPRRARAIHRRTRGTAEAGRRKDQAGPRSQP